MIEELALGSIKQRARVLVLLESLQGFPVLTHEEVIALVDGHQLWGRGLGAVDVHLLGSVMLVGGAQLWTRDKRLLAACRDSGVAYVKDPAAGSSIVAVGMGLPASAAERFPW